MSAFSGAPRFVSAETVRRVLDWDDVIARLRHAYSQPQSEHASPPRIVARDKGIWLRSLTAVPPGCRYMGSKLFGIGRLRGLEYVVVLIDQETGRMAGFVDANPITAYRTAATSAVAVDRLAPANASTVGLLGSGDEARTHIRAVARVRKLRAVTVFSPTQANREAFAAQVEAELGIACQAVGSAEEAVGDNEIVIAAARSRNEEPILFGRMLKPGMTVVSVGSTLPEQREIDPSVVETCDLIVCDMVEEVVHETGDMIAAAQQKIAFDHKLLSLGQLMSDKIPRPARLPLFKSVGAAIQDVVTAELALEKAIVQGLAVELPIAFETKGNAAKKR
jgi:ornithine cyclodeaminase/alanine dehydrogenase